MRLWFVLLVGVLLAAFVGVEVSPLQAQNAQEIPEGIPPRDNDHTDDAKDFLEDAADTDDPSEARRLYEQALEAAKAGIEADARNPRSYYQAGLAYLGLGDYVGADSMLARAEELYPRYRILETQGLRLDHYATEFTAGDEAMEAGNTEQAQRHFENADAIYKERPEAALTLGQIYAQNGELEKSLDAFQRAVEVIDSDATQTVDSTTADIWLQNRGIALQNIAQLHFNLGNTEAAARVYQQIVDEDPADVTALTNLAVTLVQLELPDSARAVYDDLLARDDLTDREYFNAGVGLYQIGEYRLATDAFRGVLQEAPRNRDALQNLTQTVALMASESQQGSSVTADSAAALDAEAALESLEVPDSAAVYDQWIEVIELAERLLEMDPRNGLGARLLAQALVRTGDEQAAVRVLEDLQGWPFEVDNLRMQMLSSGGGALFGSVVNKTLEPGSEVTLEFTFYGEGGRAIATETLTAVVGEAEMAETFQLQVQTDERVRGYSYEVVSP